MNINQMMKQAQQMQERLQQQMADMRVEASAGGGMVTVVVNGNKQIQSLKIDPEVVSKEDVEMLQDLILAAINDANRKAEEQLSKQMSGLMGGMKIPGSRDELPGTPHAARRSTQAASGHRGEERAAAGVSHSCGRRAKRPIA